jgi:hypothetical protein
VNGYPTTVEATRDPTLALDDPFTATGTVAVGAFAIGMAPVTVAVAVRVSVKVGLAEVSTVALGFAVAELVGVADAAADAVLTTVADADGVADVVADATRVGVAVGTACPEAAVGGSNPHSSPATSRPGTTIRLINGRMRVSIVKWISDNSLGLYLPNPIPTQ